MVSAIKSEHEIYKIWTKALIISAVASFVFYLIILISIYLIKHIPIEFDWRSKCFSRSRIIWQSTEGNSRGVITQSDIASSDISNISSKSKNTKSDPCNVQSKDSDFLALPASNVGSVNSIQASKLSSLASKESPKQNTSKYGPEYSTVLNRANIDKSGSEETGTSDDHKHKKNFKKLKK